MFEHPIDTDTWPRDGASKAPLTPPDADGRQPASEPVTDGEAAIAIGCVFGSIIGIGLAIYYAARSLIGGAE